MPVYEARPANATNAPIVIVISEIWGVHEWVKDVTRRFAKDGYYAVAPELFKREGGVGHLPNVPDILKIVFAVPRKQVLGDVAAAVDWTKKRPGARADRVGVTGHCWGGSTVYQVAATNPDIRGAVAWYGPPARPYPDTPLGRRQEGPGLGASGPPGPAGKTGPVPGPGGRGATRPRGAPRGLDTVLSLLPSGVLRGEADAARPVSRRDGGPLVGEEHPVLDVPPARDGPQGRGPVEAAAPAARPGPPEAPGRRALIELPAAPAERGS